MMDKIGQHENRLVTRDSNMDLTESLKRVRSDTDSDDGAKVQKISVQNYSNSVVRTPLFLIISNADEGETLSKVTPFVINKALVGVGGEPKSVKRLKNGTILLESINERQSLKFLKMTSFFDQEKIKVTPHTILNSSRGIVFSRELLDCPLDEVKAELKNEGVTDVIRMTRKENGVITPTPGHILVFNSPHPPEKIKAGYLSLSVRPFYRNPQRCYQCQRFGHSSKVCPGSETCCRCGQVGHSDINCTNEENCVNCKGKHQASSRNCKVYQEEKEILKISTDEKLSFLEARKEYRRRQIAPPRGDTSYAKAASSPPAPSSRCSSCSSLEEMVRTLSEQVAALVMLLSNNQNTASTSSATVASSLLAPSNPPAQVQQPGVPEKQSKVPLSETQKKALQAKIKAKIADKVSGRSKGGGETPSPRSSQSSLLEDLVEDPRSRTAFHTMKGKFAKTPAKQKTKINYP